MSAELSLQGFVATGDRRGAADWLIAQFQRDVVGLCRAIVRDAGVAEDLAQDVFVRAFTSLDGFRGEASPRTWLLRIARNRFIDHLRQEGRVPWRDDSRAGEDPDLEAAEASLPECPVDAGLELHAALATLAPEERALVVFRVLHGLDYAELSREMTVAEGTLRMRYKRAIEKLREALSGEPVDYARSIRIHPSRAPAWISESRMELPVRCEDTALREALARTYLDESARLANPGALQRRLAGL